MTPHERITACLAGKSTDIIPYVDGFNCLEARLAFFGPRVMEGPWHEVALLEAELFQSDWIVVPAPLNIPGSPGIFCDTVSEDATHLLARTFMGGVWYWKKSPYYAKAISHPVRSRTDLDSLPDPDWERLRPRIKAIREPVERLKEKGYFVIMEGKGSFESAWMLFRGLEETWMDIALDPDMVREMARRGSEAVTRLGLMVAEECPVDGIWITNDLGTQTATYFSPKSYRELFWEYDRSMVDAFHRHGLKAMLHSHGNVMSLIGDFVHAGYDSIDPFDRYDGMDLASVKAEYGHQVTLKGGISCTIGSMTEKELCRHVTEVVRIGGNQRFILSGAGGVPPEMTVAHFNAFRESVRKSRRGEALSTSVGA